MVGTALPRLCPPYGLLNQLDCFVASAPRNDAEAAPPPHPSPSFRGAPLGANPESRAVHGAGFRVCAQEGASRNDANTHILARSRRSPAIRFRIRRQPPC